MQTSFSDPNHLTAIVLLTLGMLESVVATLILPKILSKNPKTSAKNIRTVCVAIQGGGFMMFALAAYFYFLHPITNT